MRIKRLFAIICLAGSLAALSILFSEFLSADVDLSANHVKIVKAAYQSPNETATSISSAAISIPGFSLPAPFHIQSNFNPCFLFEIFIKKNFDEEHYTEEPSLHPDTFFEIMFRLIISPNAP